jgi:hypothetical protein
VILVDSSVWIARLHGHRTSATDKPEEAVAREPLRVVRQRVKDAESGTGRPCTNRKSALAVVWSNVRDDEVRVTQRQPIGDPQHLRHVAADGQFGGIGLPIQHGL